MRSLFVTGLLAVGLLLGGCRGQQSDRPPIHPNLNMDFQERFDPQEANPLFEDNASMRKPVTGTVPRGQLRDTTEIYAGRTSGGEYVERIPIPVTREVLERGQERYNIYCTPCHGQTGEGDGIILQGDYGYPPASSYHIDRLRQAEDGYLYDVIANGTGNMPAYGQQVPVRDRWAIVAYIRALQRSQSAQPDDLPASVRTQLESGESETVEQEQGTN